MSCEPYLDSIENLGLQLLLQFKMAFSPHPPQLERQHKIVIAVMPHRAWRGMFADMFFNEDID